MVEKITLYNKIPRYTFITIEKKDNYTFSHSLWHLKNMLYTNLTKIIIITGVTIWKQ